MTNMEFVDGNVDGLKNFKPKQGKPGQPLEGGVLFSDLSSNDRKLIDNSLNMIGLDLKQVISEFFLSEIEKGEKGEKEKILKLVNDMKYAIDDQAKKSFANQIAKIMENV